MNRKRRAGRTRRVARARAVKRAPEAARLIRGINAVYRMIGQAARQLNGLATLADAVDERAEYPTARPIGRAMEALENALEYLGDAEDNAAEVARGR